MLKYLQGWRVHENFALTCRSVYSLCLFEIQYIPSIAVNLCSPTSISSFQISTVKSLILNTLETAKSAKENASIIQMIRLFKIPIRLDE